MTRRERILKIFRRELPDQVPCCPDISVMVPLKMKKKPFWEFFINEEEGIFYDPANINLLKAYLDACNYFGTIAWAWYLPPKLNLENVKYINKIIDKRSDRRVVKTTMVTPEGNLESEILYFIDNPPFTISKFIKDFKKEFRFLKYFYASLDKIDFSDVNRERKLVGDAGVNMVWVSVPSLVNLDTFVDGGLGKIGLIYYDYPELILKHKDMHEEWTINYLNKIIEANCCDEIGIAVSGLMTWQSPQITRALSLDGIKQITKICKQNNIISHLHCCGFEKELVKICAEETDLDVIEPLEIPPQGDIDLGEIKKKYGDKLILKGNLHTSSVMLSDVRTVETAAIDAIKIGGEGGGFILSTGDQCGRDTPPENIFKLGEVCEKYGKYKN